MTAELFLEPARGSALAVGGIVEFDAVFPASGDVEVGGKDLFDLGVGFVGVVVVHNCDHFNEGVGEGVDEGAARLGGIVFIKGVNARACDGIDVEALDALAMVVCCECVEHLLLGYKTLIVDIFAVDRDDQRAVVGEDGGVGGDYACGTAYEHFVIAPAGKGEVAALGLIIFDRVNVFLRYLAAGVDRAVEVGADKVSVVFSHILIIPLSY